MALLRRILIALCSFYITCMVISTLLATKQSQYTIDFTQIACIRPHSKFNYLTCSPLIAKVNDDEFIVPANFDSDLASIPHWFWSFITPEYSALVYPALLHDYLYLCPGNYSRDYADNVFYSAMLQEGMSKHTASKMYWAVRWFGGRHFNEGYVCE
jgi:hypothetical protein